MRGYYILTCDDIISFFNSLIPLSIYTTNVYIIKTILMIKYQ